MERLPVTILGGYLGAGKTSLLNYLLRTSGQRVAVIVNDFGDVNIDADLIESDEGDTIALSNGCICCSLVDGFGAALSSVLATDPRPDRLLIEASGVADPGQLAAYAHGPGLSLDGVITVVDADQVRGQVRSEYIGDVIDMQISAADLVVLNKLDLVEDRGEIEAWLAERTNAAIVPAERARVPAHVLLGPLEPTAGARSTAYRTEHEDRYETWTEESAEPLQRAAYVASLDALPAEVLRVKGVVRFSDSPDTRHVLQIVGPRRTLNEDGPWTGGPSRTVFIALGCRN